MADSTQALTQLIKILTALNSEERHRIIDSALIFLGDKSRSSGGEIFGSARYADRHRGGPPSGTTGEPDETVRCLLGAGRERL